MVNNTAMRIPIELRHKVACVTKTREGTWTIDLTPGYFSHRCYDRTIYADTKKEALRLLDWAVEETFREEDAKGRTVTKRLSLDEVRQRYPELPEGNSIKSNSTDEPAQYVIYGLADLRIDETELT